MPHILLKLIIVCALAGYAYPVVAHQQKAAITTVLFNQRTQNLEVMHRFNLHDAEHAVRKIFGPNADIIAQPQTQMRFSKYVKQRFQLATDKGEPLPLQTVGYEIDGKFFWVYQEMPQANSLSGLTVRHAALQDVWPSQINTVNFEGKGPLRTLVFNKNEELLQVSFDSLQ